MTLREQVIAHLWVEGPVPAEYLELTLARDVYRTWPLPPSSVVARHLTCISAENEVLKRKQQHG